MWGIDLNIQKMAKVEIVKNINLETKYLFAICNGNLYIISTEGRHPKSQKIATFFCEKLLQFLIYYY
jgi:hypothetical protein